MKKIISLLVISCLLIACSSKDDSNVADEELLGTWKITEVYADPGDGSGTFIPIESNKFVTFNDDGTVISNGSLCGLGNGDPSTGIYSILDSKISSSDCVVNGMYTSFEISGSKLTMTYICIEGCGEKYVKVN